MLSYILAIFFSFVTTPAPETEDFISIDFPVIIDSSNQGLPVAIIDSHNKNHLTFTKNVFNYFEVYRDYSLKFPVKVSIEVTNQHLNSFERLLKKSIKAGNKVINYSLADTFSSPAEAIMLEKILNKHDVLLVVAAGNGKTSRPYFPCAYPHPKIICVGAGKSAYSLGVIREKYSNFGSHVDFYASGIGYGLNGTSFAAPRVSAALALIWAYNPELTALEVVEKLRFYSGDFVYTPDVARKVQMDQLYGFKIKKNNFSFVLTQN